MCLEPSSTLCATHVYQPGIDSSRLRSGPTSQVYELIISCDRVLEFISMLVGRGCRWLAREVHVFFKASPCPASYRMGTSKPGVLSYMDCARLQPGPPGRLLHDPQANKVIFPPCPTRRRALSARGLLWPGFGCFFCASIWGTDRNAPAVDLQVISSSCSVALLLEGVSRPALTSCDLQAAQQVLLCTRNRDQGVY